MALELIQNADDAKAQEIIFDITDRGLLVRNSGQFTYCGNLHDRPCRSITTHNYSCDFHRIADVGSGGKLAKGENIGRFGIGFVSTYQITDHPEIRSAGIKLTLRPEDGQWLMDSFDEPEGTSFFLPWAEAPNSAARIALGISHVSATHIAQLTEDFQRVVRNSLLFLRHVRKAEVRKNGRLLLACDLERGKSSDLTVSFRPIGKIEHWHILRADAADAAKHLFAIHPRLEGLNRSTKIDIGLRINPEPLDDGLLYAFLPTEQSTGLPLHINADFFPESDRKAVIFAGHQHEQAWNEMLVDVAASEISRAPEALLKMLGHIQFWRMLGRAYDLFSKSSGHPPCFKRFWERMKAVGNHAHIALAQDSSVQLPSAVILPRSPLSASQAKALLEVGGRLASEDLRPYQTAMNQLGAPILTLDRFVTLLEAAMERQVPGETQVAELRLESFYRPIWSIANELLPEGGPQNPATNPVVQRLLDVPFVLTEDLYAVTIAQSYLAPASVKGSRAASLLPRLAIALHHLLEFPKISRLIRYLDLGAVATHIDSMCMSEPVEDVIGIDTKDLRDLYSLFADLDRQSHVETSVYRVLRNLPIWRSSRGLIKATQALLPGNFTDPTGKADLLDTGVLTDSARDFVSSKLGIETQTVEAFVRTVLPTFFSEAGPLDDRKYAKLMTELASHATLVNDDGIRELLGSLPIVPTQDGRWSRPMNTYRRTAGLMKILGDAKHLWLDDSRVPSARSVQTFVDSLGILRSPIARHLVERVLFIAEKYLPAEESKRASSEAFYVLCDNYDEWKERKTFQDAIDDLRNTACFPAEGDAESWHRPDSLYAPYRADAFRSQAFILDFRNTARLKTDLLERLGFSISPETDLVIGHLRNCVLSGVQPNVVVYQVLNERAQQEDPLIEQLAGSHCIYVESQKGFVRTNQLYWSPQQLGRYAFTIPNALDSFKPLFMAIGVKNAPEAHDFVAILLDIVGEYFEQSKFVLGIDRAVYDICLASLCTADQNEKLMPTDLLRLQEAPSILNIRSQPTHPDEVLLQDSEWHAAFFDRELDQALCRPAPELWPFVEKIGVRRLSESAQVTLEFVDGPQVAEDSFAEKLTQRMDIVARLLHDKPTLVRERVRTSLSQLKAVSYDVVRIRASVPLGGDDVLASPASAQAFYDIHDRCLILARPVGDRIWSHVLNALFHQLMPKESGIEISKLTLSVRPLLGMSVEDAHRELTDAGIPYLEVEIYGGGDEAALVSDDLDDLGSASLTGAPEEAQLELATPEGAAIRVETPFQVNEQTGHPEGTAQVQPQAGAHEQGNLANELGISPQAIPANKPAPQPNPGEGSSSGTRSRPTKKSRAQYKDQWDRRLLSYVRKNPGNQLSPDANSDISEHNLAVEALARAAVCRYERSFGRIPEQMAQTHPGYDIISRNPLTGEERYIEVKGVNGIWNITGVGLSRLQFSNAQDYGERYWLYVVESAGDPQNLRVHPIQSPAMQVTSFMFDGNWRDAATEELADPTLAFIVGAKVKHPHWGYGRIAAMDLRGGTRIMSIEFEKHGRQTVTLNLQMLTIVEDGDDPAGA